MTSTALQVHTGNPPATQTSDDASRALAGMAPMTFEQFVAMGDSLVQTGFLPKHITTGAKAAAIILAGQELGMAPMRALRSLILVEGKVVENADSQLARFKSDGGRAVWKRLDEKGATLHLRHPNGDEHEETFTIEDAGKAKLLGKDVWQKYPKAMLRSRVITAGLKSIGWEGGAGAYDPDEAKSFGYVGGVDGDGVSTDAADRAADDAANGTNGTITLATDAQKARITELLDTADVSDEQREKIARVAGKRTLTAQRADEIIAGLEKLVPQTAPSEQANDTDELFDGR